MNQINAIQLKQLIEASLFVLGKPLSIKVLKETVLADFTVSRVRIQETLDELQLDYQDRGVQLVKVASGYRFQTQEMLSPFLQPLWQEKAPKYSRATMETLAVIAYRQPVTRGDIEQIRGVAISSHIIKSLLDRHWIKAVGHKEVPGRPALYATTPQFLDYFGLKKLAALPALTDVASLQALFDKASTALDSPEDASNDTETRIVNNDSDTIENASNEHDTEVNQLNDDSNDNSNDDSNDDSNNGLDNDLDNGLSNDSSDDTVDPSDNRFTH